MYESFELICETNIKGEHSISKKYETIDSNSIIEFLFLEKEKMDIEAFGQRRTIFVDDDFNVFEKFQSDEKVWESSMPINFLLKK